MKLSFQKKILSLAIMAASLLIVLFGTIPQTIAGKKKADTNKTPETLPSKAPAQQGHPVGTIKPFSPHHLPVPKK